MTIIKNTMKKISKFYRRRKKKQHQFHCEHNNNISEEEQNQKLVEYRRNYYIAYTKYLLIHLIRFLMRLS